MMAVESVAKSIASVINTHAIPRLLRLNGINQENPPVLTYGSVERTDLAALGQFLKDATDAGVLIPDRAIEDHIRALGDLPPVDDDERDEMYPEGYKYGPQPVPDALAEANAEGATDDPAPGDPKPKLPAAPKGDGLPEVKGGKVPRGGKPKP